MTRLVAIFLIHLFCLVSGCGYTFQTSKSVLVEKYQVRRIYLKGVVNNSLRPGLENTIYNAAVKAIRSHGGIKIVSDITDADAVLESAIDGMTSTPSASTSYKALSASSTDIQDFYSNNSYNTEYIASLNCSFFLKRNFHTPMGINERVDTLWSGSFSRSKPYPAFLQIGVPGTTSQLIADTELDRTISELSAQMMVDVRESMLAMF